MAERNTFTRTRCYRQKSTLDEIQSYDIYKIDSNKNSHDLSTLSSSFSGFVPSLDLPQQRNSASKTAFYNHLTECRLPSLPEEKTQKNHTNQTDYLNNSDTNLVHSDTNLVASDTNLFHFAVDNQNLASHLRLQDESIFEGGNRSDEPTEMRLTLTKEDNTEMEIGSVTIYEDQNSRNDIKVDIQINNLIEDAILEDEETDNESYSEENFTDGYFDSIESWVDLSKSTNSTNGSRNISPPILPMGSTPDRVTPLPFGNGEEYLRLLREAQKDSNQSSARVSHTSSRKDTPKGSPKSPPNSPNTELLNIPETSPRDPTNKEGFYINYFNKEGDFIRVEKNTETDWIWDWSSRPDQAPPKEWKFVHPSHDKRKVRGASIRNAMIGNSKLFSRDVLYTLLITNVLSLILGTGIGIWLSKKSSGTLTINAVPLN